jgi:hypothetical protein
MRLAAFRHTEMVRELALLQAVVSSAMESALGRSPNDTFHMEVVGELVVKFIKREERHSQLVQDLVLDNANGLPSLVASMSTTVVLLEGQIDAMASNRVDWGSYSALVAAMSHFPELKS